MFHVIIRAKVQTDLSSSMEINTYQKSLPNNKNTQKRCA